MLVRVFTESVRKPVVLLAAAERWTSTARLALSLRSLGCDPMLVGPGDHPAVICGAVSRHFRYDPLRPLSSLHQALHSSHAAAVLPADETVTCQLGELWERMKPGNGRERDVLQGLLERSLGAPEKLRETGSRMPLQRAAEAEGVATPETLEIRKASELSDAMKRLGAPMVLKADASSGGRGVCVVRTLDEAERAWRRFAMPPRMTRAMMRGILRRDWNHMRPAMLGQRRGVTAQRLVRGVERTAMAVAHDGELLAVESFEVVQTWKLHGPSSVLRRVQDPRTDASIRALVRRLQITGFSGFDFIVDAANGKPLLLERNARPTQLAHLSFGSGRDVAAAYVRAIVGREVEDRAAATGRNLIALFPHELQRDPESPVLQDALHDVPWESQALIDYVLRGDARLRALIDAGGYLPRGHESSVRLQIG